MAAPWSIVREAAWNLTAAAEQADNYQVAAGTRGAYDVLIDGFQVTMGGLKGKYLNAWAHSNLALAEYEDAACERPEDGLKTACERPEDGHTQDDQDVLDVLDVDRCDQTELSLAGHGSSPAPLRGDHNIPQRGPQDKNNHNSKDTGSVPNPPVEDPAAGDWNQDAEDAFNCWRVVYGNSYNLEDFLLLQEYDSKINATLQGHGTLPLIIQWAKWVCNDNTIRNLESSTDFREEIAHNILPKFTKYTNTTSPRVFIERCQKLYLANDCPARLFQIQWDEARNRPNRHDKVDCLEEELMYLAEEVEEEMTLLNPWEENEDEMTILNPWED